MTRIAIFASGSGTNAENIINYFKGNKKIEVGCIISNKKDKKKIKRAKNLNNPSAFFSKEEFKTTSKVIE